MYSTEFWATSAILAVGAATAGSMVWLEKQPKTKLQPRLFPTTLVMVVAALVTLMAAFHMLDLIKPVVGP